MTDTTQNLPPKRTSAGRIALIITGSIASLMAVALIGFGALALWGNSQKDDNGYLSTDTHRFAASTHALATDNLEIDLDGAEELLNSTDLGDIRLEVAPEGDKSMFVGIARTDDVESYLGDVAHTSVTDIDSHPFEADYRTQGGNGTARPAGGRAHLGRVLHGHRHPDARLGCRGRRLVGGRHERRRLCRSAGRRQRRGKAPVPDRDRLERNRKRSAPGAHRSRNDPARRPSAAQPPRRDRRPRIRTRCRLIATATAQAAQRARP